MSVGLLTDALNRSRKAVRECEKFNKGQWLASALYTPFNAEYWKRDIGVGFR